MITIIDQFIYNNLRILYWCNLQVNTNFTAILYYSDNDDDAGQWWCCGNPVEIAWPER